jgi:hypothetical protein
MDLERFRSFRRSGQQPVGRLAPVFDREIAAGDSRAARRGASPSLRQDPFFRLRRPVHALPGISRQEKIAANASLCAIEDIRAVLLRENNLHFIRLLRLEMDWSVGPNDELPFPHWRRG